LIRVAPPLINATRPISERNTIHVIVENGKLTGAISTTANMGIAPFEMCGAWPKLTKEGGVALA
jgi:hypothetical protein